MDGGADELELADDPHPASTTTPITAAARHPARAGARRPARAAGARTTRPEARPPAPAADARTARAEARPPGGIAVTWTAPEFPASDVTDVPFGPAAPCAPCSNYDDIAWRPVGATRAWLTDAVPGLSPRRLRSLVTMRLLWRILMSGSVARQAGNGPEPVSNKQETLPIDTYQYWRIRI